MAEPIQPMKLPFKFDFAVGAYTNTYVLEVELTAEQDAEVDRESLQASGEMIEFLPRAVNLQLLGSTAGQASAQVRQRQVSPDGRQWRFSLYVKGVPPASYAVLLSLLVQTGYSGDPLGRVSIRAQPSESPRDALWLYSMAQSHAVLINKSAPPFMVEWGQPQRKQRLVTIEFVDEITLAVTQYFEEAINIWDHLVTFGGFELDFVEQQGFDPSFGSFSCPSPKVIQHRIFYDGDRVAFRSLISMLEMLHVQGNALSRGNDRVEIAGCVACRFWPLKTHRCSSLVFAG